MNKDLENKLHDWRTRFDGMRTDIASLTTRHGDVMIADRFDNAYHLKQALQHLSDCELQVFEAVKIIYGEGEVYGDKE